MLERYHLDFVRAGRKAGSRRRATRLDEISQRLATLGTEFSQNVLADEQDFVLPLSEEPDRRPAATSPAMPPPPRPRNAGWMRPIAVTLSRSSVEPFLQFADDRALREQLFKAWVARGDNANAHNNRAIIAETLTLRAERAHLLGYESFADFKLADSMAGTPASGPRPAGTGLGARPGAARWKNAMRLQALIAEEGGNFTPGALGLALLRRKAARSGAMISTRRR